MARTGDIIKILDQVLEALRGGKKLAAREREKLQGNALLSLSAFGGEPNPDVLEDKVLLPLRTRYRCSATEEAEVLRWLVDDMPESNPWKTVLGAVRDFKVLAVGNLGEMFQTTRRRLKRTSRHLVRSVLRTMSLRMYPALLPLTRRSQAKRRRFLWR
jgi:hypothetical protein